MLLATVIRRWGVPIAGLAVLIIGVVLFLAPPSTVGVVPNHIRATILVVVGLTTLAIWTVFVRRRRSH